MQSYLHIIQLSYYLTRDLGDGYCEMKGTLSIDAKIFEHERAIAYKYVVHSPKTRESQDDCYEYLHEHHLANANRLLKVPKQRYQQACGGMLVYYLLYLTHSNYCTSFPLIGTSCKLASCQQQFWNEASIMWSCYRTSHLVLLLP